MKMIQTEKQKRNAMKRFINRIDKLREFRTTIKIMKRKKYKNENKRNGKNYKIDRRIKNGEIEKKCNEKIL